MFSAEFKVKMNDTAKILKDHGLDMDGKATEFLRDEIDRFSDPYISMQIGTLKNNKSYPNKHSIKYNSPYARYQYYGKVMVGSPPKKVTNKDLQYNGAPKRGAKWDQRMMRDRKNDIIKDMNRFIGGK